MNSLTKKAGEFRAVCKTGSWRPLEAIDPELRFTIEGDPGNWPTRWDNKLRCEVAAIPCELDTSDRATFEKHMAEVHGLKSSAKIMNEQRGYAAWPTPSSASTPWRGFRLAEDGAPFKDTDSRTETCTSCGLVSEVPLNNAGELWWREHRDHCTGVASAVA